MEDEDFGFTLRDEKILNKVFTAPSTGASVPDAVHQEAERDQAVSTTRITHDANGFALATGEGVATETKLQAPPEVGNDSTNRQIPSMTPVSQEAPNIPNVVEYHLKVKPKNSERKSKKGDISSSCSDSLDDRDMRKDRDASLSSDENKTSTTSKPSKMTIDNNIFEGKNELPQMFQVKYLGSHDARGLWGIKHTRRPVDNMVSSARSLPPGTILPFIKLVVSKDGVSLLPLGKRQLDAGISKMYSIDTISYGVQDLVYTRVFSMIVVRDVGHLRGISPFECHGFVCESRHHARQLTYALANAFQVYSQSVKAKGKAEETASNIRKRFAIDLRSPEEIEAELTLDSEA